MLKFLAGRKKILAVAIAVALACTSAFAQSSVESDASNGIYLGDADNFMSTIRWGLVDFEKYFIEAKLNKTNLDAGFGMDLGVIYLGAYYTGNFINGTFQNKIDANTNISEKGDSSYQTWTKVTSNSFEFGTNDPYNNVNTLIGFANMGVKLGYTGSGTIRRGTIDPYNYEADPYYEKSSETTFSAGEDSETYTNTIYGKGLVADGKVDTPSVEFGINLGAIRPYISIEVPINTTKAKASRTTTTVTKGFKESEKEIVIENKGTYVGMVPAIGSEIDMGPGRLAVGYTANFDIRPEGYYTTTTNKTTTTYNEKGSTKEEEVTVDTKGTEHVFNNRIGINYKLSKDVAERLSVGAGVGVTLEINSDKKIFGGANLGDVVSSTKTTTTTYDETSVYGVAYTETTETTTENPKTITKTLGFNTVPTLGGAVRFQAVPEKVALVIGAGVRFNINTTNTKVTREAVKTTTTKKTNSLTGEEYTEKEAVFNGTVNESGTLNVNYNTAYKADFAAIFTPTENFNISTGLTIGGMAGADKLTSWTFNVGCEVKF